MKIAIWWNIPCKSIVPVAKELANINNIKVTFISQSDLSVSRKQLGWILPEFGRAKYLVLPEMNWKKNVEELIIGNFDIHIFNGVYLFPKIRYALDYARRHDVSFGVISEAYHNPYTGFKQILKTMYTRIVTPFRVFYRIKKAKFLLGASGNNVIPFLHLGWKKDQFFPFGYFPENAGLNIENCLKNTIPHILCTGYITKNKGQHLLLHSLSKLKKERIKFRCIITGFGPEEENVKKLASDLNVKEYVKFVGVVSDVKLNEIKLNSDLLVAPGIEEPWGIRINESLLAGTPVIVSDKIGASELIRISKAGKVFISNDIDSLTNAIKLQLKESELIKSKENAILYSSKITPKSAANYILDVINFTTKKIGKRPIPQWLIK